MRFDSTRFPATAEQTGFEAGNLEKVLRLRELLNEFHKHSFLRGRLVLKGGTAFNLFYLGLVRPLSSSQAPWIATSEHTPFSESPRWIRKRSIGFYTLFSKRMTDQEPPAMLSAPLLKALESELPRQSEHWERIADANKTCGGYLRCKDFDPQP
jgi:hypothetical protein